ncbi:glutathione S-transferase [Stella humosa]|uniref:Glutathione S-transferase n=1 Tax=Stella humosa TaxID=94 RepID=A0A3N1KX77_9PROT|nr:glutathione S-transferase N-terminal domain-containing protein [Stella humosa]ROP83827.1 glutathione S-transferase [Stella humosa]BBK32912.1 glutathione S-transferase [Stella humosa]
MYRLYNSPGTAGMAPHILLRELAVPHEMVFVDRDAGAHKTPEYLALNPLGRLPTLVDGDLVLFEAAAICLYLADRHPEARLAPPVGHPDRARLYQWLMFLTNTIQADLMIWFYPERVADDSHQSEARVRIEERLAAMFAPLDAALAGREWLVGEHFSIGDAFLFMLARWSRNLPRKARDMPNLGPYLARIASRPAVREMFAVEGLSAPYY